MNRTLLLCALFTITSGTTLAATETVDFAGEVTQIQLGSTNPLIPLKPAPNSPLTVNGVQLLNGNPFVVGTITFDPDFQEPYNIGVTVPVTFSVFVEGFTVNHTIGFSGFDTFSYDATGVQAHLEGNMQWTGVLDPYSATIDLNMSNGAFTGGTFEFMELDNRYALGEFSGTILGATRVNASEPDEAVLLLTGFVGLIWWTTRRRGAIRPST